MFGIMVALTAKLKMSNVQKSEEELTVTESRPNRGPGKRLGFKSPTQYFMLR